MATTIKLDTNALRFLIELDPEFKLEVQKSVLQNIVDDVRKSFISQELHNEIRKIIEETHQEFLEEIRTDEAMRREIKSSIERITESTRNGFNSYTQTRKLTKEAQALIHKEVSNLVKDRVKEALGDVSTFVNDVKRSFEEDAKYRLERIVGALDASWKNEMANQIRSSVADEINAAFKKSIAGE
nr:hypothetical protein ORM20_00167 [Ochrobactrum phage ORM_20]